MSRGLSLLAVLVLAGCSPRGEPDVSVEPPSTVSLKQIPLGSLTLGTAYLREKQSPDGAWRSDVYATFKDGTALTPLVVTALQDAHDAGEDNPEVKAAIARGIAWLARFSKPDGTIDPGPDGLDYPVYTAALTIKALSHPTGKEYVRHRETWVRYLKDRQLTEKLGWKQEDKQYGGWGYCRVIPRKPEPNVIAPPLIESNLSATLFALESLRAAGEAGAEIRKAAAIFVRRCQNADGGFHFIYDDPVRNKAGVASTDPPVFHSYGSTTADGLRALHLCGLPIEAASGWFVKHFRADMHPGTYVKAHEPNREAVYYYYVASVTKAFREQKLKLPDGREWAAELEAELVKRQHKDGRWENPVDLVRENDPLVATANAVAALSNCKR
jgi:hypothetical protein